MSNDQEIDTLFVKLGEHWDGLDGLVHSIAYAPAEALGGDFLDGISREAFKIAHDVSSFSFPALAKAARPLLLKGNNPALVALTYLGAERVMPNYNLMGLAKASLEAATRYMAYHMGRQTSVSMPFRPARSKHWRLPGIGDFGNIAVAQRPCGAATS